MKIKQLGAKVKLGVKIKQFCVKISVCVGVKIKQLGVKIKQKQNKHKTKLTRQIQHKC